MVIKKTEKIRPPEVLFIVGTIPQAEIFNSIRNLLAEWDILALHGGTGIEQWYEEQKEGVLQKLNFPHRAIKSFYGRKAKNIIKSESPDIVVVGHDTTPLGESFVEGANSLGIPTLLVPDGIVVPSEVETRYRFNKSNSRFKLLLTSPQKLVRSIKDKGTSWHQKIDLWKIYLRFTLGRKLVYPGAGNCSRIAVLGGSSKSFLASQGVDPERIVVTGSPKFDKVFHCRQSGKCKKNICNRWGIPLRTKIIALLTQPLVENGIWDVEQRAKFVSAIANAQAKLPNTKLVVKPHPTEKEDTYYGIISDLDCSPIICQDINLAELLNSCSLTITVSSTTALEAMAIGKPTVIVNLFNSTGASFYKGSGALFVEREEDILPTIQKALYDTQTREGMPKSMEKFVYQQAYLQDGQASKRIADLITRMAATRDSH